MRTPRPVLFVLALLVLLGLLVPVSRAQPPRGGTRSAPPKTQPKAAPKGSRADAAPKGESKPSRPAAAAPADDEGDDENRPLTPLEQVEADAQACRTAAEAVQVYKIFLANPKIAAEDRKPAEKRLAEWVEMEEREMRRLGKKWVTQSEYEEIERKTENLIKHSFELMKLGNNDLAKKDLVSASRLNPESGKADFVMGFIYSLIANNDAKAVAHFNEVLKREPNNAYALNNLAVSEVFLKRYAAATKHFRRALEIMPDLQEVCDNVAVAIGMDGQVRHRQIPDDQAEELNDLYRKAIYELKLLPFSAARSTANQQAQNGPGGPGGPGGRGPKPGMGMQGPMGPGSSPPGVEGPGGPGGPGGQGQQGGRAIFAYKLFGPSGRAMAGSAGQQGIQGLLDEPKEVTVSIASGTGFVIAPGYILTNRHVIEGATDVTILNPNDTEKHLVATVIAESESPDLALLRCDDLATDPLPLAETMPRPGSEVMVLGYPGGALLGLELKNTDGKVTSKADPKLDGGCFLFSAIANPGNSGGPILDKSGNVVGVVVAIVRTSMVGSAYSVGIPMERVWPFLEEHLPDVEPFTEKGSAMDWADITERHGPSVVFITAKVKRGGKKADGQEATDDFAQGGQGAPGAPGFSGPPGSGPPGSFPPGSVPPGSIPPGGSYPPGGSFPPGSVPPGSVPPGSFPPGSAPPGLSGLPGGSPPPSMAPGYPGSIPPDRIPGAGVPGAPGSPPPGYPGTPGAPGAPGGDGGPPSSGGYPPPGGTPGFPGGSPPPGTPGAPPSSGGYPPPGGTPGVPGGAPGGTPTPPPGYPGAPGGSPPPGTPGGPPGSGGYPPPGGTPGAPGAGNSPSPPAP